jgi:hypothetical protein
MTWRGSRLKSQGLWWRVEGQSRLAEERVDEAGPALDGPEPGADYGLELVEGGGGVGCPGRFSSLTRRLRPERLPGFVFEADPRPGQRRLPRTFAQVADRHSAMASSSRSKARCAGTCGLNPRRCSRNDTPRSVQETPDSARSALRPGPGSTAGPASTRRRPGRRPAPRPAARAGPRPACRGSRGALRGQGPLAAGLPGAPPLVNRLRADPQRTGDLPGLNVISEHLRGLQPHLLAAGPPLCGQPAAIRIPHDTGLNPASPAITQARRP